MRTLDLRVPRVRLNQSIAPRRSLHAHGHGHGVFILATSSKAFVRESFCASLCISGHDYCIFRDRDRDRDCTLCITVILYCTVMHDESM